MRRRLLSVPLALLTLALALAADDPKPKADGPKDQAKLVGTWTLVSATYDGRDFNFPEGYKPR